MHKLDSLQVPVTIFINERLIYRPETTVKNFELLHHWAHMDWVDLGNHSFNHARFSTVGVDSFAYEIEKGEAITRELARLYDKSLQYFRIPYNDLGKDSLQQVQVKSFLNKNSHSAIYYRKLRLDVQLHYEHYLVQNKLDQAKTIADMYLEKTLAYFDFFDSLSQKDMADE